MPSKSRTGSIRDRGHLKRINQLIEDITQDPFDEIGKPEPLCHALFGSWFGRIDQEHRLVFAEVLGHSSTSITEDLYQHVTPGMKADATARVADLLGPR